MSFPGRPEVIMDQTAWRYVPLGFCQKGNRSAQVEGGGFSTHFLRALYLVELPAGTVTGAFP